MQLSGVHHVAMVIRRARIMSAAAAGRLAQIPVMDQWVRLKRASRSSVAMSLTHCARRRYSSIYLSPLLSYRPSVV